MPSAPLPRPRPCTISRYLTPVSVSLTPCYCH